MAPARAVVSVLQATTAPDRADRRADLRMLSWVREEVRLSLEQAHKGLRRHLRETLARAEADIVDPAILRASRQALHQAAGALELVGQGAAARVVAAAEAAVVRFSADASLLSAETLASVERGSFAVLDYLAHVLAGKRVSTLALFPQYRVLQELARADVVTRGSMSDDTVMTRSWSRRLTRGMPLTRSSVAMVSRSTMPCGPLNMRLRTMAGSWL